MALDKDEIAKTGVQFGSLTRYKHPLMQEYIYACKKNRCILDLEKIIASCHSVQKYVSDLINDKKKILFVCTKKKVRELVKAHAEKSGMPYMCYKWVGGLFTNFGELRRNIRKMQNLFLFTQTDSFSRASKKRQKQTTRELERLQKIYSGVSTLNSLPDIVFVIGLKKEAVLRREVNLLNMPIMAVCNTNSNPVGISCILLGNDESVKSVEFLVNLVSESIISTQNQNQLEEDEDPEKNSLDVQQTKC